MDTHTPDPRHVCGRRSSAVVGRRRRRRCGRLNDAPRSLSSAAVDGPKRYRARPSSGCGRAGGGIIGTGRSRTTVSAQYPPPRPPYPAHGVKASAGVHTCSRTAAVVGPKRFGLCGPRPTSFSAAAAASTAASHPRTATDALARCGGENSTFYTTTPTPAQNQEEDDEEE